MVYHALDSDREWIVLLHVVMMILRTIDYSLYNQFRSLEADAETVLYEVFSHVSSRDLIQSDAGGLLACVTLFGEWDLQGRPHDIQRHSRILRRLNQKRRDENVSLNLDNPELLKREQLFNQLKPTKVFDTVDLMESLMNSVSVSFNSAFELIELCSKTESEDSAQT